MDMPRCPSIENSHSAKNIGSLQGLRFGRLRAHGRNMLRIRIWQWPNLLSVDTALIALVWQAAFAATLGVQVSAAAQVVLGLSVWLTYMADRLFDVAKRPLEHLHAARHCFAKQHFCALWGVWCGALIANLTLAFIGLSTLELRNGAVLLALCLLYTTLNQALSRRFFPKEICVAIIYVGGVIVFLLPNASLWAPAGALTLLCLINCLLIGSKEQRIDAALKVRSLSRLPSPLIIALEVICALSLCILSHAWALPIGLSLGTLGIIHLQKKQLSIEVFRVLTDSALLIGPSVALLTHL